MRFYTDNSLAYVITTYNFIKIKYINVKSTKNKLHLNESLNKIDIKIKLLRLYWWIVVNSE